MVGEQRKRFPLGRLLASVFLVILWGWFDFVLNATGTLQSAEVAGKQFENSDSSYLLSQVGMRFFSGFGLPTLLLVIILVAIWWKYIRLMWVPVAIVTIASGLFQSRPAEAFFEKTDRTEAIPILPNQSAFWIPDVGANKDTQAHFGAKEYQDAQKVEFKRFNIPHSKLVGSAGTSFTSGWDYFVPTGRLILVDRTPYARDWQGAANKGSSTADESMACQTNEGLDWTIGISIGVTVKDEDAFKFLNSFGIQSSDRKIKDTADSIYEDGQILFQSTYYSRTVAEVMDNNVHRDIHTLVCRQVMARTLDQANMQMNEMMDAIETTGRKYLADYGITLTFIGWADTVTFSPDVQAAINRKYIAAQDEAVAKRLQPYTETIKALAAAQAIRSFGEKTDGKLPTTIVGLPPQLGGLLSTLLNNAVMAPAAATTPTATAPLAPNEPTK